MVMIEIVKHAKSGREIKTDWQFDLINGISFQWCLQMHLSSGKLMIHLCLFGCNVSCHISKLCVNLMFINSDVVLHSFLHGDTGDLHKNTEKNNQKQLSILENETCLTFWLTSINAT